MRNIIMRYLIRIIIIMKILSIHANKSAQETEFHEFFEADYGFEWNVKRVSRNFKCINYWPRFQYAAIV